MKILVMSDTHGDQEIIDFIFKNETFDYAIHAGDYESNITTMEKYFNYFVRGNNDFDTQPQELFFTIADKKFYLTHGHILGSYSQLDNREFMEVILNKLDVDFLIHGHTHIPKIWELDKQKYILNPGSTTYPRGNSQKSYLIIEINSPVDIKFNFKEIK